MRNYKQEVLNKYPMAFILSDNGSFLVVYRSTPEKMASLLIQLSESFEHEDSAWEDAANKIKAGEI